MYALNPSGGKECLAGEEILVGEREQRLVALARHAARPHDQTHLHRHVRLLLQPA